jgi:hypothetical protein
MRVDLVPEKYKLIVAQGKAIASIDSSNLSFFYWGTY